MSKIIRLIKPDIAALTLAGLILSKGGLVVYPTETFYAIAADYKNSQALARLQLLKRREPNKPFSLILSRIIEVKTIVSTYSKVAFNIMLRYWPGPLTLVFSARLGLNRALLSIDGGIALRISSHPIASALAQKMCRAITATSANLAGQQAVASVKDLDSNILDNVDLVLDSGSTPGKNPSTILDVRIIPPRILRQGAIYM